MRKPSAGIGPCESLILRDQAQLKGTLHAPYVLLDERGPARDTMELARFLERIRDSGVRQLDFAIGDSQGFDDADRKAATHLMTLGPLTLPHRLARVLLAEQLYRVTTILSGHPYHHAGQDDV